ncbi:LAQU0S01e05622g1_1 [Lachancea quebecensis]|uniref:LAQU0S01e05622g1_1 n=1 Tax=Lachancea quebecensis TaxID=1654605 RepID=A0A0P1KP13_9SACH|nr:LAQU0S01e05622g1_1 [Lachancea quebecensis]
MIRTPTRTKTLSFAGPQVDFHFPSPESAPNDSLDNYHMSNHHLLNDAVGRNPSQNSSGTSNGVDSAHYSFANISDNTTGGRNVGNAKRSSQVPSWSSGSGSCRRYPITLAPMSNVPALTRPVAPDSADVRTNDTAAFLRRKRSPEDYALHSISTSAYTIPTADNISFQITFGSSDKSHALGSLRRSPSLGRKLPSRRAPGSSSDAPVLDSLPKRAASVRSTKTKLKRSQAVRCKGGLLQFFLQIGARARNRVRRWRLAVRKKLFTYKAKRLAKKNKKQTTSHLKRGNGYVSNIQRSISSASLRSSARKSSDAAPKEPPIAGAHPGPVSNPLETPPKTTRKSLRRSPSSIKRAASILTRANSSGTITQGAAEKNTAGDNIPRTKMVRSGPSLSLSSIVRQPSIVVNNKVIPLASLNEESKDYTIEEEDEDEYVIDTDCMKKSARGYSESSSDSNSGSSRDETYHDTLENPTPDESLQPEEKVSRALDAWNHYLRAVVAQRVLMRLQIRRFQESGGDPECQELIDAIISDYEENSSSHYESDLRSDSTSLTSVSEYEGRISSSVASDASAGISGSIFSARPFQQTMKNSVKRSLTLPVGFRV